MEIAGAAEMAMAMKRAEFSQSLSMKMMKESLQQDAAVLQVVAAATQAPSPTPSVPVGGVGSVLDITV